MADVSVDDLRHKVNALLARANHPNTPQPEAETALALASKLMLKHGLSESDLASRWTEDAEVVTERVLVGGKYRVQRQRILFEIAVAHSCDGYRDFDEGNSCVLVVFGRRNDIFAARTLFAAADALGARLLPQGDRAWRISWWKGFQSGLGETLATARRDFEKESPGAGLVLVDRRQRAKSAIADSGVSLVRRYVVDGSASSAYGKGQAAGRTFGAAGRSFATGVRGELT